ncbi:MAG: UDP-3-O-acyl-N-acetylglucosamine deacetylase [Caulobacteraceae bacterium]|nr:UDP-3-O-acyl-N-acetylglucosamine deacetylase [Caulobacteraceae bacterium]
MRDVPSRHDGRIRVSPDLQHTLAGPTTFAGVGIHSGRSIRAKIHPASAGSGIGFVRTDVGGARGLVAARGDQVCSTRLGTQIGNADGVTVSTIEHLMAAFAALAIDNAWVELDGPETPIMDGSCAPFLRILDRVGRRRQDVRRRYIEILEPVTVADGDKRAALTPADQFEVAFEILFDTPAIGRQSVDLIVDEATFRRELADCRTFGFLGDVQALRAAGLGRGGSLDNVVMIEQGRVMNPEGLRRPDEFARHKAVDAIGDLYLLGAPIIGRYQGLYAGHELNNALVGALMDRPQAWRYASAPGALARAG